MVSHITYEYYVVCTLIYCAMNVKGFSFPVIIISIYFVDFEFGKFQF